MTTSDIDLQHLRESFRTAERARQAGNQPFGAVLADQQGRFYLEAENSIVSDGDPTCHAERNLVSLAYRHGISSEDLADCTMFASTEPCPMCAGAIYWSGVARIVFGLSQARLYELIRREQGTASGLILSCTEILSHGSRQIEIVGPELEDEALSVHEGFWTAG